MRILVALTLVLAACSGPTKKPDGPVLNEGSAVSDNCCCKSFPLTSEDGKPVYESNNRMECSSKHGECVPEVQCASQQAPPEPASP